MFSENHQRLAAMKASKPAPEPGVKSVSYSTFQCTNRGSFPASVIDFNLPAASASPDFMSLTNSYLTIPMVHVVKASTAFHANCLRFGAPVSSNQLISSVRYSVDGVNFISDDGGTRGVSTLSDFEMLTQEDENVDQSVMNWAKDNSDAYVASAGVVNNTLLRPAEAVTDVNDSLVANEGFRKRMRTSCFDPAGTRTATYTNAGLAIRQGRSQVVKVDGTTIVYHQLAVIPLRRIHNLFSAKGIKLNKGMLQKLSVSVHTGESTQNVSTGGVITAVSATSRFGQLPFQCGRANESYSNPAAAQVTRTKSGIESVVLDGVTYANVFGRTPEIHLQFVSLTSDAEKQLLAATPQQLVQYHEIIHNQVKSVAPSSTHTVRVAEAIPKVRFLLVKSLVAAATNGAAAVTAASGGTCSIGDSPFASNMMCAKHAHHHDVRLKINNQNVHPEPLSYSWEFFCQNMRRYAAAGGYPSAVGQITYDDWMSGDYAYELYDLTQLYDNEAEDNVKKDITYQFTSGTLAYTDVDFYLASEIERRIDTATGAVIQ